MATGVVRPGSDLKRKQWVREGLVQAASKSFWNGMTAMNTKGVVYQVNNETAKAGHTVVFDFDGNLSGKAVKGKDTAFGKGEQKRKFSDKIMVERYRLVVDNGDKFDAVDIGDLSLAEHADSRAKLADLFVRWKDQGLFDAAQGNLVTLNDGKQGPSHIISTDTFTFDTLIDIETTLRTSQGYTTGGIRRPLVPWNLNEQDPVWLVVIDASVAAKLRKDQRWNSIITSADPRGNGNRVLTGEIKRVGALLVIVANQFFGDTAGTAATGFGLNDSSVEISGLRQWDKTNGAWTGQEGFSYGSNSLYSRCLILGAGGLQMAFGMQPDYKVQESEDFGIKSESCLEVWCEMRKTALKAENADYKQAKIANLDFGVVALDVKVSA
ncbi:putative major capsid protein [Edwardsiella phage vB_EpP_ZHX]|uniref:Major capsid protein n=1 Tax=Edwardsiella phage IW-1 TaxID=1244857 RepID=K4PWU8_9CAUD|nr:putative major capsid protein [Edwardsiella phage vB_EpP_ZHX]BAM63143.1 hypothetical protein [Edwardsiella phage IW-1]